MDASPRDAKADDGGVDGSETACPSAPVLPPTSPTCTALPYNAASESYVVWVSDSNAPGGGHRVPLGNNQSAAVGGHTYTNLGAGLVGGGGHGVYGDASFDVDGVANALTFHLEGCAVPVATDTWELAAAVTRLAPLCSRCPEVIARRYSIRHTGSGASGRYTFDAEGPPQGCAAGADLLEVVLYE
jgi:hypothetical protein